MSLEGLRIIWGGEETGEVGLVTSAPTAAPPFPAHKVAELGLLLRRSAKHKLHIKGPTKRMGALIQKVCFISDMA